MIIFGRPVSGRRILKSIFGAIVMLAVIWAALALAGPLEQTMIEAKK